MRLRAIALALRGPRVFPEINGTRGGHRPRLQLNLEASSGSNATILPISPLTIHTTRISHHETSSRVNVNILVCDGRSGATGDNLDA